MISEGRILQLGTPAELVSVPADHFVATFTGAVLLPGRTAGTRDGLTEVALDSGFTAWSADALDGRVSRLNHLTATITSVAPMGNRVRVQVGPVVAEITAASAERLDLRPGATATASFKATAVRLFPA